MHTPVPENQKLIRTLWGVIGLNFLFVIWTLLYSSILVWDDIEHLRAAYFISLGDVPYRDFFEHHHPLLWYLLWPLIKILPHSTTISIYICRVISLLISLGTGYYFYQITKKFIGGKTVALLAIVLYFTTMPAWYSIINIKPDVYMRLFYFMGLYHLFLYFRYQKRGNLYVCGTAWTIAFLLIQTTALFVLPLVFPTAWFLYHHKRKITDFLCASVLPIILLSIFVGLLYYNGIWDTYYETNWRFNSQMSVFLQQVSQSKYLLLFSDIIFITIAAIIYYWQTACRKNIYMLSLILLCLSELLQRIFWVSIFSQYYIMFFAAASMIMAPFIYKMWCHHKEVYYVLLGLVFLHIGFNYAVLHEKVFAEYPFVYLDRHNVPQQQRLGFNCGIYHPRLSYYWNLPDVYTLHNVLFIHDSTYNINQILDDENVRYYCASGREREGKFFALMEKLLPLTTEQKQILQRHKLNADFDQKYRLVQKKLYERREP